jgi:DNA-binding transcriptional ArsR family regulator
VISAGTATAVLFRMRAIGYVTREEGAGPGLQRRYAPTPEMVETFRRRLRIELGAASMVIDGVDRVLSRLDDPQVFATLMSVMGAEVIHAARNPRSDIDPINQLSVRTAGILLLWDIVKSAEQPGALFGSEAEVEISVAALARRYQVSRSHVLSILRDLTEAGYLERLSRDGLWRLKPALREALLTFFGIIYLGVSRVTAQAEALLAASEPA